MGDVGSSDKENMLTDDEVDLLRPLAGMGHKKVDYDGKVYDVEVSFGGGMVEIWLFGYEDGVSVDFLYQIGSGFVSGPNGADLSFVKAFLNGFQL